jgi:ABC-type dipeptide/oligopeptide/nickel transport system ATPase component
MPPRKKKEEPAEVAEIVNWYEKIPKEMLDKAENPNFNVHKLKVPFRMCVVAPSGSGKSNFLVNLIHLFSQGKGTFADITIITRNKDEPLYNFLTSKCDQIQVKEGLTNLPQLDKLDKRLSMYEYATKEKFSPLLIDLEEDPSNRFRKGFKEILDPAQYVPIPKTL